MGEADAAEELACRELVELVTEYLEGALPAAERLRFEQHLAECPGCRAYLNQVRLTVQTLGGLDPAQLTHEERSQLLGLFHNWRDSSDA